MRKLIVSVLIVASAAFAAILVRRRPGHTDHATRPSNAFATSEADRRTALKWRISSGGIWD